MQSNDKITKKYKNKNIFYHKNYLSDICYPDAKKPP